MKSAAFFLLSLLIVPSVLRAQVVAEEVRYSRAGGLIAQEVMLAVEPPTTPGGNVRYTLDNTEPIATSPEWTAPLAIAESTVVRARVFADGLAPGPVRSRGFLRLDESLASYRGTRRAFSSTLPLIVIGTFGGDIDHQRDSQFTYVVVLAPGETGHARLGDEPDYEGRGSMHLRGESSAGFPQRSFTWETHDETGGDFDVPLLDMPAESDWVLYAPYLDKSLMRNALTYSRMRELRGDGSAMRTQLCEVFVNRDPGTRVSMDDYRGVYVLVEKIKRDANRVNVAKLKDTDTDPAKISGGYIFRRDKPDADKYTFTTAVSGVGLQVVEPDPPNAAQAAFLKGYLDDFERVLSGPDFADPVTGYAAFIEPDTFIDAEWFVEMTRQIDGHRFSSYFQKDRGGRVRALPLWDYDLSLGNANYLGGNQPQGWYRDQLTAAENVWNPRLHEDPAYTRLVWDRYWMWRSGLFSNAQLVREVARLRQQLLGGRHERVSNSTPGRIQTPAARHFRRWPILGTYVWPNAPGYERRTTFQSEVSYLVRFATQRLAWLDRQNAVGSVIFRPPRFSRNAGPVRAGSRVAVVPFRGRAPSGMSFARGTIYRTTDGRDPRAADGTPQGAACDGALRIDATQTVKARLHDGTTWSPLAEAIFTVAP